MDKSKRKTLTFFEPKINVIIVDEFNIGDISL